MVAKYLLPFGKGKIECLLPENTSVDWIAPPLSKPLEFQEEAVRGAIKKPVSGHLEDFRDVSSVAIAINDKTRPVPHNLLLPILIDELEAVGISASKITLFIATGSHQAMREDEFPTLLSKDILNRVKVISHNIDETDNFVDLGVTSRGTPIHVNKKYHQSELRIVVGDIELHHFAGFSGGVKSAVIGLGSRDSIQCNHIMLTDPSATIGIYEDNPLRQDIEESGEKIGIHFALNAILTEEKKIQAIFLGKPRDVMNKGIPFARQLSGVQKNREYDMVIASAGGYPKDINLYQSQKAISHARLFARQGGSIILAAECCEGAGSKAYEMFMQGVTTIPEIYEKFSKMGFVVGAHKAVQFARQLETHQIILVSMMAPELVKSLLLTPARNMEEAIGIASNRFDHNPSIAVLPYATGVYPMG